MKVGFTGTRNGLTPEQRAALSRFISELPTFEEFHHGDCVGADDEAADIVGGLRAFAEDGETWDIHSHPPSEEKHRAHNPHTNRLYLPKAYLDRNKDIVDACELLVACPKGPEERRSGTWSTVRYAVRRGKPVRIIWPDGRIEER